jgi:hypothetical protein
MARGRFISNDVISDKETNDLSSDTCRLAYVYLITIADCEGRVAGDPAYLKSLLFPRRYDITPDMVREFILEWVEAGFVIWYECSNGEKALRLVNFEKHQRGLRKEREAASVFEDPAYCKVLAGDLLKNGKDLKEKEKIKNNKNTNLNINGNSGVSDGLDPDLVGSNPPQEKRSPLLEAFEKTTQIIQPSELIDARGFIAWEKEIAKWEGFDATVQDVKEAIEKADKMKSNLSWPGSITKYMASAIARRKRGVSSDADTDDDGLVLLDDGRKITMEQLIKEING